MQNKTSPNQLPFETAVPGHTAPSGADAAKDSSSPTQSVSQLHTVGVSDATQAEINKWRSKDLQFREHRAYQRRGPARAEDRIAYAERILQEEGRTVRQYLPSTPERRKLQKAAWRAKQKSTLTPEQLEERRKKDRERKALQRSAKSNLSSEEWMKTLDDLLLTLEADDPASE